MTSAGQRRCGNCRERVGDADVTCAHCGALLAAYEAPAGATMGTEGAVTPLDPALDADPGTTSGAAIAEDTVPAAPPVRDVTSPVSAAPTAATSPPSPLAKALEETRAKVNAAPTATLSPAAAPAPRPAPVEQPTPPPEPQPPPPMPPAPRRSERTPPVHVEPPPPPIQDAARRQETGGKTSSPGQVILFVLVAIVVLSRLSGGAALLGTLVLFAGIAFVVWFIVRVTNATGRKTTHMPPDERWRRRR